MKQQKKLEFIADDVFNRSKSSPYNYSLMSGKFGEILFLYYYSLINNEYQEKADMLLDELIENISTKNLPFTSTYCNGFAGFGLGLHMLEEAGFIDGSADTLDDIDVILSYHLKKEIGKDNYDFLHGVVGIGFYFLKHYKYRPQVSLVQIKRILDYLESSAIYEEDGKYKWTMIDTYDDNKVKTNISLSHGMASIVIFLSRTLHLGIIEDNIALVKLLKGALKFVLAQQIDHSEYGSYFPNLALESIPTIVRSRLAWCYGDLGIAMALWQAGNALKDQDAIDFAKKILKFSATRTNLVQASVHDAGLCHGAAGVAQVFLRMGKEMQLPELYKAYEYWKDITLRMGSHQDGVGGYKAFRAKEDEWIAFSSVLEGAAGIGFTLLSEVNSDWDEILLLSFR